MTVFELKKELQKYPDNMDVFIKQTDDEFGISLLNEVKKVNALFSEGDGNPETEAYEDVVILSDL